MHSLHPGCKDQAGICPVATLRACTTRPNELDKELMASSHDTEANTARHSHDFKCRPHIKEIDKFGVNLLMLLSLASGAARMRILSAAMELHGPTERLSVQLVKLMNLRACDNASWTD